jgi:hypothetical protein
MLCVATVDAVAALLTGGHDDADDSSIERGETGQGREASLEKRVREVVP